MPTINQQLETRVQQFVQEVSALVKSAALDAVSGALGAASPARRGRPVGSGRGPGRPAMSARPARGGRRAKRSTANVDATAEKLLAYVKANDGKRIDEIAAALGTTVKVLTLPAQKLLAAKAVKTSGRRRGTKYHVGGGSSAKAGKRAKKA